MFATTFSQLNRFPDCRVGHWGHTKSLLSRLVLIWFALAIPSFSLEAEEVFSVAPAISQVKMGLAGFWKVGFPARAMVEIRSGELSIDGQLEVQTFDGDGVPVIYRDEAWSVALAAQSSIRVETNAKHGRGNRPIVFRVVDKMGQRLIERELTSEERGVALPATQPWIVSIGTDQMKPDQGSMKSARGALSEVSTSQLIRADQLPEHADGYQGIDLLLVSSGNEELNNSITSKNGVAIRSWIEQGGRCVLTIGKHAESWLKHTDLAALIPGPLTGVYDKCEPGPLESFLNSQSRLSDLTCAGFSLSSGTVELTTQTSARVKFPLLAKWAYGSGKLIFLATELDGKELLQWESRTNLLKYLSLEQWERKENRTESRLYQGYEDLSGQLNAMLDFFPKLILGNLALISILVGLFCVVVGPADYFLVARAWRKPQVTWLTLSISAIGCCIFVGGLARRWKPDMPSINSLEFIDIDYQTGTLRGRSFAHCYGGERGSFDFQAHRRAQGLNTTAESAKGPIQLDWFGQPGKGLGGFDSTVATDRGMPSYLIETDGEGARTISATGIPAAGTKALCAQWSEPIAINRETCKLSMVSGSIDLIEGSFENPLDVDLLDALLVYRGRAYALPTRIRIGEKIVFTASTVPKDVTRRLQRRINVGGEEKSTPWNPADTGKLDRLMELISFHKSAGGVNYTGLYNRYLNDLDCSDVIRMDRAVLVSEFKESSLAWSMQRNSIPIQASEGQRKTCLRLIIPIEKPIKPAAMSASKTSANDLKP